MPLCLELFVPGGGGSGGRDGDGGDGGRGGRGYVYDAEAIFKRLTATKEAPELTVKGN
jgi:hypothetical protein